MKTKKILIFTLIFSFLFLFINNCFAVTCDNTVEIPDCVWSTFNNIISYGEHGYYVKDSPVDSYATNFLVYSGAYNSYLFSFCESVYFDTSTNKTVQDKCNDVNGYNSFWVEIASDGTYKNHSTGGYNSYYYYSTVGSVGNVWYPTLVYSTFDLYDQNNTLFFLKAPTILGQVMKAEAKKMTIQKELVGLVPLAIGLLVLVIGFFKAWKMFLMLLRRA